MELSVREKQGKNWGCNRNKNSPRCIESLEIDSAIHEYKIIFTLNANFLSSSLEPPTLLSSRVLNQHHHPQTPVRVAQWQSICLNAYEVLGSISNSLQSNPLDYTCRNATHKLSLRPLCWKNREMHDGFTKMLSNWISFPNAESGWETTTAWNILKPSTEFKAKLHGC